MDLFLLLSVALPCFLAALTSASSTSHSPYKKAACRVICKSDRLPIVKKLCACPPPAARHNLELDDLSELLLGRDDAGALVDKRWGLDMDLEPGWTDNNAAAGVAMDDLEDDDARKIFRFGKRGGLSKKWSMEDDLSMALPWEGMEGANMDDESRAGGKIFRFGKKRAVRSSNKQQQTKA